MSRTQDGRILFFCSGGREGAPMNEYLKEPDVPSLVTFIVLVGLWGFLSCGAVLQLAALR